MDLAIMKPGMLRNGVNIKKEATTMMYRTSQKYWLVRNLEEIDINGVSCLRLRLEREAAITVYMHTNDLFGRLIENETSCR